MEIWKDIPGYEGFYQASSLGRVRSLPRMRRCQKVGAWAPIPGCMLTPYRDKGYLLVRVRKDGASAIKGVHRLVLAAFKGEPPAGAYHCNHINGIKDDNHPDNLEWCSPQQNANHAVATGLTQKKGIHNQNAKLTDQAVSEIRALLSAKVPNKDIAVQFGVHRSTISFIKSGKIWTHVP